MCVPLSYYNMDPNTGTNRKLVIPRATLTTLATKHKDSEESQIDHSGPRPPTAHPVPISDQDYSTLDTDKQRPQKGGLLLTTCACAQSLDIFP